MRRRVAVTVGRQQWIAGRYWWVLELLRDLADRDPNEFHRFLWSHHLAYAETYDIAQRFGAANLHPSRRIFFDDLVAALSARGKEPAAIRSVFEAGCSLGYLLRHLETDVFTAAPVLEGNDIDRFAVRQGQDHLNDLGSKVRLHAADLTELPRVFAGRRFDVVMAAGVLMYLQEGDARKVVEGLLRGTGSVLALAGLADPDRDNFELTQSGLRDRDGTFIHNLDRFVADAGGRIISRRWDGARQVDGNTIYFVFAEPGSA
ncbi:MAG: class I SAM-dependent methyltransferase [Gemmatimonadota bacterium]